nr:MAG TPA: hypothetical protein [Caudoviricetes sp.]
MFVAIVYTRRVRLSPIPQFDLRPFRSDLRRLSIDFV